MSDQLKRRPLRAVLAGCVAVLAVLGVSQAVETSAASTDAVNANSGSLSAAANVLPRSTQAWCDNFRNGSYLAVPNWESQVSVTHINQAFDYKMYVLQDNGTISQDQPTKSMTGVSVGSRVYFDVVSGGSLGRHTNWNFTVRVYSVNRLSNEMSAEWIGWRINQPTVYQTNCSGSSFVTGSGWPSGYTGASQEASFEQGARLTTTSAPTTTESTAAPSIAAPSTKTPSTTTPSTTTPSTTTPSTTTPTRTTDPTATSTPAPAESTTVAPATTESPAATTTTFRPAASTIDLGDGLSAQLIDAKIAIFAAGSEKCSASVADAEKIADHGDNRIAVTDSKGDVHYFDTNTCKIG